jgi:hypothetical protein
MRTLFVFLLSFIQITSQSQNYWPKNYGQYLARFSDIIQDYDGGFLCLASTIDLDSYLIKFDANANFLWEKKIFYLGQVYDNSPQRLIRDNKNDLYITGDYSSISFSSRAFILRLNPCYNVINSRTYVDTTYSIVQYQSFGMINDLSNTLIFIHGWGFNDSLGQFFVLKKADLLPQRIYNSSCYLLDKPFYKQKNSAYLALGEDFYLKGKDTTKRVPHTSILKLECNTGGEVFYNFLGFDENISSVGSNIFKNSRNNFYIFSIFHSIKGDTIFKPNSPILFECDTNGKMLNYRIYHDRTVDQALINTIQLTDSTYIAALSYLEKGQAGRFEYIKLYSFNAKGELRDSLYLNNLGHKFQIWERGISFIHLIKTNDNKFMCVFQEEDSSGWLPKITFLKFDEKLRLDTTEIRNLVYDQGCTITADPIVVDDKNKYNFHAGNNFPLLELKNPDVPVEVPQNYTYAFYPNPIRTTAIFEFETPSSGKFRILLLDNKGAEIREVYYEENLKAGKSFVPVDLTGVASGNYYLGIYLNAKIIHTIKIYKD